MRFFRGFEKIQSRDFTARLIRQAGPADGSQKILV